MGFSDVTATAPLLGLRYDLRLPHADSTMRKRHLDAALEQIRWAEQHDFSSVTLSEHHGSPDGYLPSPIVFGAAIARRRQPTSRKPEATKLAGRPAVTSEHRRGLSREDRAICRRNVAL